MKLIRKLMAAVLSVCILLAAGGALSVPAFAAGGTITVTPPSGTTADSTTTYQLYKVFVATGDGTGIRYNTVNTNDEISDAGGTVLLHSKGWKVPDVSSYVGSSYDPTTTNHFIVDDTGNVHWGTTKSGAEGHTQSQGYNHPEQETYDTSVIVNAQTAEGETPTLPDYAISAIKDYIKDDSPIQTVSTTGTTPVAFTNVDNGYYYITTTTGTAVSVTSTNPNASVTDKNAVPTLTKAITGVDKTDKTTLAVGSVTTDGSKAIAELGSTVTYQVTAYFHSGFENIVLHDTLDEGELRLVDADPTITYYDSNVTVLTNVGAATIRRNQDGNTGTTDDPDSGDTLTIDFKNITSGTVDHAVITYSATVESDSLSSTTGQNAAYLSYGTNTTRATTDKVHTDVQNAKYTVTKQDNAGQPLAGAGFILSKTETNGGTTKTYYYKKDDTNNNVSWVELTLSDGQTVETAQEAAVEAGTITQMTTTSGEGGNVIAFTGLADGTYTLDELTVPTGYMRAGDVTFAIKDATEEGAFETANLEQTTTVTNRAGSELPTTGGIGTTIFYIIGGCLVAGAVVLLIVRKKKKA